MKGDKYARKAPFFVKEDLAGDVAWSSACLDRANEEEVIVKPECSTVFVSGREVSRRFTSDSIDAFVITFW